MTNWPTNRQEKVAMKIAQIVSSSHKGSGSMEFINGYFVSSTISWFTRIRRTHYVVRVE